jgi:hypothetical protein
LSQDVASARVLIIVDLIRVIIALVAIIFIIRSGAQSKGDGSGDGADDFEAGAFAAVVE